MTNAHHWLPPLILLNDHHGSWERYLPAVYAVFHSDFVLSLPQWPGKRVGVKRHPVIDGKGATFWHFISEGAVEADRIPDLRRCERIGWPRPIMDRMFLRRPVATDPIVWWKSRRASEDRYVLSLPEFSYVVVVADRGEFVLPWTAFWVEKEHRRQKLRREFEEYWRATNS